LAVELRHFLSDEDDCDYLPHERATIEYRVMAELDPSELEQLLERGWRRFGPVVFRPACRGCQECVSLRLPVADFRPSRSQRRARNRCRHLTVEMGPPGVDQERLDLHARWHAAREETRGWEGSPLDAVDYAWQFGIGDPCAREVAYRQDGKLVGLGICDETDVAYSAVYFFHDPAYARLSLGVNHLVTLMERARQDRKAHVYLGYRVLGCPSMRYKAGFRPHDLLVGRPGIGQSAEWRRAKGGA
jgi:arginyl-tRNA--protein-N-Asp/Glu arginylyltransferase